MDRNVRTMLEGIQDVASKVAPLVGGGAAAPVMALAASIVALSKVAEHTFGDDVPPQLPAEREKIEQAIRDHVAATSANLRGD